MKRQMRTLKKQSSFRVTNANIFGQMLTEGIVPTNIPQILSQFPQKARTKWAGILACTLLTNPIHDVRGLVHWYFWLQVISKQSKFNLTRASSQSDF